MREKISVIVPIYRVEKYIERCVRSLFEQTFENMEFVFVNDCTPDHSMEVLCRVLKEYPMRIPQVQIINKEHNGGQAAARNSGMAIATGEYIIHCDSDDWIDRNMYERMYEIAKKDGADIVICGVIDETKYGSRRQSCSTQSISATWIVKNMYKYPINMYTVNKLVRKELLDDNNLFFYDGINMWEDNGLMYRVFYYANKVSFSPEVCYHYNRANENSITNHYGRNSVDQMIKCAELLSMFFADKPDAADFECTINMIKFCAKINLIIDKYSYIDEYRRVFRGVEYYSKIISRDAFSTKGRIRLFFVEHNMAWIFVTLFKTRNIILNHC